MNLALGPLPYYWPRQQVFDFYEAIANAPVDIVYLGETVCARRHELRVQDWAEIAGKLAAAGKQAILGTQTLIESESDLKTLRRVIDETGFLTEANDMGAVRILAEEKRPFVAGPFLNIFNGATLGMMARLGATGWVMPVEMSPDALRDLQAARPAGLETEVFVYGRLPLAFSARCFTARHFNLQKDDCQFKCLEFPDGLLIRTREGEEFLTLNGIQTQSSKVYNLIGEVDALRELGVAGRGARPVALPVRDRQRPAGGRRGRRPGDRRARQALGDARGRGRLEPHERHGRDARAHRRGPVRPRHVAIHVAQAADPDRVPRPRHARRAQA